MVAFLVVLLFSFSEYRFCMDVGGHPQATVALFPWSLAPQGVMAATMGITCLFICLCVIFLASQSIASGGSVPYIGFS